MNYLEKVNLWKNFKGLDQELALELENLTEKELEDAFTNDLAFGTGGLRGVLGVGTNRMNIYIVRKATLGFECFLFDNFRVKEQFEPAFRFRALFSRDLKYRKHIGKTLMILILCDVGKHA